MPPSPMVCSGLRQTLRRVTIPSAAAETGGAGGGGQLPGSRPSGEMPATPSGNTSPAQSHSQTCRLR
eukprot:7902070-Lingulodinium_polyedra.AAC.1